MHAIAQYRLQRIAVIDFDAHFGDGTAEILRDDPRVMFFNLFETDIFPFPEAEQYADSKNMLHTPPQTRHRQPYLPHDHPRTMAAQAHGFPSRVGVAFSRF